MLVELLAVTGPFAGLPADLLRGIAAHGAELRLSSGRTLFSYGDPADAVFLVLDGTVTLYRDQVGRPLQLLARLGSGDLAAGTATAHAVGPQSLRRGVLLGRR